MAGSCENKISKSNPHREVTCTINDEWPPYVFSEMNLTPGTVMLPRLVEARLIFAHAAVVFVQACLPPDAPSQEVLDCIAMLGAACALDIYI